MLKTGTVACSASSSSSASGPVRTPIAAMWRDSTRAVSPTDSPRESCSSSRRRTTGWPPSSKTPASKDSRVRVECFSKMSAMLRPSSARDDSGAAFSASARSSSVCSSSRSSSVPVSRWRVKPGSLWSDARMRVLTWNLYHGRAVPPAGRDLLAEFAAALAGWDWDVALLQEVPPWWPPALARACDAQQRTALTSRNALLRAAPARRAARARPHQVKRRRRERDPRARARRHDRRAPPACCCAAGPSAASATRVELDRRASGARTSTPRCTRPRARRPTSSAPRPPCSPGRAAAPALLGGDFNVRAPAAPGFEPLGGHGVDHVLGHGLRAAGATRAPRPRDRCPTTRR